MESVGDSGNVGCRGDIVGARDRKVWDWSGMNYDLLGELPKPDVAGSISVARAKPFSTC